MESSASGSGSGTPAINWAEMSEEDIDRELAAASAMEIPEEPMGDDTVAEATVKKSRKRGKKVKNPPLSMSQEELDAERLATDPILLAFRQGIEACKQTCIDILPTCPTDLDREEVVERVKKVMRNMIRHEMKYLRSYDIVNEVAEEIRVEEAQTDEEVLANCDKLELVSKERIAVYEATLTPEVLEAQEPFQVILKEIADDAIIRASGSRRHKFVPKAVNLASLNLFEDDDEDFFYQPPEEIFPTVDPITKLILTDPVRNKFCKHIYGKAAMLELIANNHKFRCPIAGCSNEKFVKKSHLKHEAELTLRYSLDEPAEPEPEPELEGAVGGSGEEPAMSKSKKRRNRQRKGKNSAQAQE